MSVTSWTLPLIPGRAIFFADSVNKLTKHTDRVHWPYWISFSQLNLFAASYSSVRCTIKNTSTQKVYVWPDFDSPRAKEKKKKKRENALHRAKVGFPRQGKQLEFPRGNHAGKAPIVPAGAYDTRRGGQTNLYTVASPFKSGPRSCVNPHPLENDSLADTYARERELHERTTIVPGPLSLSISTIVSRNRRMQRKSTQRDDNPFSDALRHFPANEEAFDS